MKKLSGYITEKKKFLLFVPFLVILLSWSISFHSYAAPSHSYSGCDYVVKKGSSLQLKVRSTASWSSSNKSIATVDSNGRVYARKGGTAVIKAVTTPNSMDLGGTYQWEIGVKSDNYYPNKVGSYKVGKDLPSGEYVLFRDTKCSMQKGFVKVLSEKGKTLYSESFGYTSFVTLKKGQKIDYNGSYMVPLKKVSKKRFSVSTVNKQAKKASMLAPDLTVKVGYGFPAGTYKVTPMKGRIAKVAVYSKPNQSGRTKYRKVSKYASTPFSLKVKRGNYLYIGGCTIRKK